MTATLQGFPLKSLPWFRCLIFLAVLIPVAVLAPNILHCHVVYSLFILTGFALALGFATGLLNLKGVKDFGVSN